MDKIDELLRKQQILEERLTIHVRESDALHTAIARILCAQAENDAAIKEARAASRA